MPKAAIAANTDRSSSAEAEAHRCLDSWVKAVGRRSVEAVTKLYIPHAELTPTREDGPYNTEKERECYFASFLSLNGLRAEINQCRFQILDENESVVMANGHYTFHFIADGKPAKIDRARFTFLFQRQDDGSWLIAGHHSSQRPFANAGPAPQ